MSEVLERYGRVADGFGSRLRRVTPDQWTTPTPCSEWDVRDLVSHVIATHRRIVANLEGSPVQEVDAARDMAVQWSEASTAVRAALADPDRASQMVSGMFGEQSFESLVSRLLCADTLFHTWDLAGAIDDDRQLDPQAVAKALDFLVPLDEAIRRPGGFAPKIEPAADADLQTRLLNFGGRVVQ
ncbi:MAG: TIGR03086 family metal-binding protein [Acidimicrobiales bacterium]